MMEKPGGKISTHELDKKIQRAKELLQESKEDAAKDSSVVLRKRAEKVAGEKKKMAATGEIKHLLEFALGQERYGIPTEHLKEILDAEDITVIPCTPAYIYGVINVRGTIVTIIDLKNFFKLEYVGFSDSASIILVTVGNNITGIVADEIFGISEVPAHQIQREKPGTVKLDETYIYGITSETTIILNIDKVLGDKSLLVDEIVM